MNSYLNTAGIRATRHHQGGFTLVEIAIVLVIIGLLLGGILRGQELIKSARVRNMANQNSGIQAAYFGFLDRFQRKPGDWSQANAVQAIPGVTTGGNGNSLITGGTNAPWDEALAVWEHLSKSQFIQGNYIGGNAAPAADSTDSAPTNAFNGLLFLFESDDYDDAGTAVQRLNLVMGNNTPVDILRELDLKIDDSFPETGVVRHAVNTGATLGAFGQSTATCVDASGAQTIYDIAGNEQNCTVVYLY